MASRRSQTACSKPRALFRSANLKLLPIAQQTQKVGKDAAEGAANARMNVQKFIKRIGADRLAANGTEYLMFLDVEDDDSTGSPALNADYYTGWSKALAEESRSLSGGRFTIVPGIYAPRRSNATWNALRQAEPPLSRLATDPTQPADVQENAKQAIQQLHVTQKP